MTGAPLLGAVAACAARRGWCVARDEVTGAGDRLTGARDRVAGADVFDGVRVGNVDV
ncbi:MAG TPA: hypothetical protein VE442_26425 [Jatrophihabitans sp.]|nr:hypothetical protein [Jatrophihabitans sp.]